MTAWLERARESGHTALLLSTCNRCELYWYGDGDHEPSFREFARIRGVADEVVLERWEGLRAVQHIFTVAAGLDSQVLGETEILGQVRRGVRSRSRRRDHGARNGSGLFGRALGRTAGAARNDAGATPELRQLRGGGNHGASAGRGAR